MKAGYATKNIDGPELMYFLYNFDNSADKLSTFDSGGDHSNILKQQWIAYFWRGTVLASWQGPQQHFEWRTFKMLILARTYDKNENIAYAEITALNLYMVTWRVPLNDMFCNASSLILRMSTNENTHLNISKDVRQTWNVKNAKRWAPQNVSLP